MSHFTVLVVAESEEELEEKLLPYHEYECTGIEQYLQWVPTNLEEAEERRKEHYPDKSLDEFIPAWYGAEKNEQGEWGKTTNPNKKWDWWVVGGRWSGCLILKNGEGANTAEAQEVDWEKVETFAFVNKEGEWIESARMGWWATTSNENNKYDEQWQAFITALQPTDIVWLCDCHI